ncbi:MAG TPA: MmgE/PrpD family protein [Xanthobacteraceae bacterium]|jgi:2-methylcitrate dehydratase PrpD|nr:MmgE/PrpD family protein [Xanthobacteraceae bacterium]
MLHQPGVTERLAQFAADTRWSDLPGEVTHQAKRSLLNFFAVALTGCRSETVETALATLSEFSGGRRAALIGRRERIDALSAAFLNAAGANVLDFCDTHVPTAIHPTAPIMPALLALGELKRVGGRDLMLAFVLGQEIACRIGLAISPSHYNQGWHITATCGVFGAAAGAGKLLGLSPAQTVWALGTAATAAAGLCECLGTPAKSVGVGNAAKNGLFAALLAAKDFSGPAEPLAGTQGFYNALNETPDLSRLTDGLGESWEIMKTSYKPYPCGFVLHPVLDCVLGWRREHPRDVVAGVKVTGNPLLGLRADRPAITTSAQSQVSVQHAVAAALVTGKARTEQFAQACVNDPAVAALRGKVEVTRDEGFSTVAAAVEIATADGKLHKLTQNAARGSDRNPMSDGDLEDKLRDAAAAWDPRHDMAPLVAAIWALDDAKDIASLAAMTVPRA